MLNLIDDILPSVVMTAEAFDDKRDAELYPVEQAAIANAVESRRLEFTTARTCAHIALSKLGFHNTPIGRGIQGQPRWPSGVVGSITHCNGYRAAAVASAEQIITVGIDAEVNAPVPGGVLEAIASEDECAQIAYFLSINPDVAWDRLLFSAKESIYKAWFPLTKRWLGFKDASVVFDPNECTFCASLVIQHSCGDNLYIDKFAGRWLVDGSLVLTAIAVPV
jgi:4'-phosphopantetheinyl transferase EntD